MWRLEKSTKGDLFLLSGSLESDQIPELQRIFETEWRHRSFVVDLSELKLVDEDVVKFLAESEQKGIQFDNCPQYIREWIEAWRKAE